VAVLAITGANDAGSVRGLAPATQSRTRVTGATLPDCAWSDVPWGRHQVRGSHAPPVARRVRTPATRMLAA